MKTSTEGYYETILKDMLSQLNHSRPGKRQWTLDPITGLPDYGPTERSTFPDWSKFFYMKPSKAEKRMMLKQGLKAIDLGYFNGNTRELKNIILKSLIGDLRLLSARQIEAFDIMLSGFRDYIEEYEAEYGENYFI